MLNQTDLKEFLEEKYQEFNSAKFIESDPVQVPHRFRRKEDIEIAGFFSATLAWGQRASIIRNANQLLDLMDHEPFDFIRNFQHSDLSRFKCFKHRTFNGEDCRGFLLALQNIYCNHGGLEAVFNTGFSLDQTVFSAINYFRDCFFELPIENRTQKTCSECGKRVCR